MKHKKAIIIITLSILISGFSFAYSQPAKAADNLYFVPNVEIPLMGSSRFLGAKTDGKCLEEDSAGNCEIYEQGYLINDSSIGNYISGIYNYAARFISILAMFMLIIAGWQWLFAAGNSEKVNNAKQTINGVLIGMILLFGGQLLLSQISVKLVKFDPLTIKANIFTDSVQGCAVFSLESQCEGYRDEDGYQACVWMGSASMPPCAPADNPELFKCHLTQQDLTQTQSAGTEVRCCEVRERNGGATGVYAYASFGSASVSTGCNDICPSPGNNYYWTTIYDLSACVNYLHF